MNTEFWMEILGNNCYSKILSESDDYFITYSEKVSEFPTWLTVYIFSTGNNDTTKGIAVTKLFLKKVSLLPQYLYFYDIL